MRKSNFDPETGEIFYGYSENFVKMNLKKMTNMLEVVGGKKAKVIIYLLKNLHLSNNTIIKTQNEIAKECQVSLKTVNSILNDLEAKKLIKKKAGSIMLSPDVCYRGYYQKKQQMLNEFYRF